MNSKRINKEEKILSDAYYRGELKLENPSDDLLRMLAEAGENTFKKDGRINIRLSSQDLPGIQRKSVQKEIPTQAFISGLIHQHVEGELQETSK